MASPGRRTAWRKDARGRETHGRRIKERSLLRHVSFRCPQCVPTSLRLCAQVTSVQLRVQLACARGHLRAPEETGCKDLRCSDKESLDGERLNWGKGVGSLGRRMGDLRSDLTRVWGALLVRLDAQGRRAPGPASRLFSAELFPPSHFPRSASLGAVSRDCLSHPFSFPP